MQVSQVKINKSIVEVEANKGITLSQNLQHWEEN
jgi:hypothetical protein